MNQSDLEQFRLNEATTAARVNDLQARIAAWCKGKGPTWWNRELRIAKMIEEYNKLTEEINAAAYSHIGVYHEAGDLMVTLMAFCAYEGFDALEAAEESFRKGQVKHG